MTQLCRKSKVTTCIQVNFAVVAGGAALVAGSLVAGTSLLTPALAAALLGMLVLYAKQLYFKMR